ncbi:dipeptidyl aminopeptidase/acylaminoacyl peptidase [Idiomarina sp. A28L]|uniref:S9 family peptidase n=1 Tax=Idiomarina sp. A28L TaxID=1036674 RepID=UPI0002138BB8|nr:prolyl oligopeptidase family serine peptidase [Idiomarina sp. A28L]EGN74567.1 dipeptidyl aminopeptidase/acylaminoacyl peptidase [Idiomarina sp. A28L]
MSFSKTARKIWLGMLLSIPFLFGAAVHANEIPLEHFFKHAEFGDAAISPTGKYLAVTVPNDEQRSLAVLDISKPDSMSITAAFQLRGQESPSNVRWVNDERLIFTSVVQPGALEQPVGTGRIYAINADGSNRRQLFGTQQGSRIFRYMDIISLLPDEPDWILVQNWAHDRPRPIAERLNVNHARLNQVASSPLNRGFLMADQDNVVRFAMGSNDDMKPEFAWRPSEEAEWRNFSNEISDHLSPVGFDASGDFVYMRSRDNEHLGLYQIELATGDFRPVLPNDNVEVDGVKFNSSGNRVIGVRFHDGVPQWHSVDESAKEIVWLRQLEEMFIGSSVTINNWTRDGKLAMVAVSSDVAPTEFFVLDTEAPALRFLAASRPWIDPAQMQNMHPISFEARDGVTLHGYKTLPRGYQEGEAVPFVVFVHGGPHGPRDRWGFDSFVQAFAHNGFGVLQINFRGSGGYGVGFERSGYGEWGAKMQDDITDGTHWIMEQGFAKEDSVCIAGASYGGFSALSGIVKEPNLYACAWAFVGVYDLELIKETGDIPQQVSGQRYLDRVLGTDINVLKERSPSNHVANIKTPLFIAHGAEDVRAHVDHYHLLKERLDAAEIEYEEMLVENEGHGFYKVENNVEMMTRVLAFMKKHTSGE